MKLKPFVLVVSLVFVFVASAVLSAQQPTRRSANAPSSTGGLVIEGFVGLIDEARVPAQEAGVLTHLIADEGMQVEKDQPLAKIDDSQPRMQKKVAEAELTAARAKAANEADIEYAQKATAVAQKEWEGMRDARKQVANAISNADYERAKLTIERGAAEIKRARMEKMIAGLTADAKAVEVEAAEEAIRRRRILAPQDGVVVEVPLHRGEWVKPGDIVLHIMRLDRVKVTGTVPLAEYSPQHIIDRPVTVTAKLQGRDVKFSGKITFVRPSIDASGYYSIKAEVENRKENGQWLLLDGMPVEIAIDTQVAKR